MSPYQLEDLSSSPFKKIKTDDLDLDLGLAMSKSIIKEKGHLILSPEKIQEIVLKKIELLLEEFDEN